MWERHICLWLYTFLCVLKPWVLGNLEQKLSFKEVILPGATLHVLPHGVGCGVLSMGHFAHGLVPVLFKPVLKAEVGRG